MLIWINDCLNLFQAQDTPKVVMLGSMIFSRVNPFDRSLGLEIHSSPSLNPPIWRSGESTLSQVSGPRSWLTLMWTDGSAFFAYPDPFLKTNPEPALLSSCVVIMSPSHHHHHHHHHHPLSWCLISAACMLDVWYGLAKRFWNFIAQDGKIRLLSSWNPFIA